MQPATQSVHPMFVLASASPRRQQLLKQIGVVPDEIYSPDIDETPQRNEHPRSLVRRLALGKANAAKCAFQEWNATSSECLFLAADTVVAFRRAILMKPRDGEEAESHLHKLSGVTHKVYTAICLIDQANRKSLKHVESRVRFKVLTKEMIDAYVASGEWHGKAGGYAIQGFAASFVTRIVGSYTNIVGLPLAETADLLIRHNYSALMSPLG